MEPSLASTFGTEGTWFEIVAAQMEFPEHLPEEIARIWTNGKAKADQLGVTVDPVEFTHQFVYTNFVPK